MDTHFGDACLIWQLAQLRVHGHPPLYVRASVRPGHLDVMVDEGDAVRLLAHRRELHAVARLHDVKRGREAIGEAVRCLRADMTGSSDRIRVAKKGNSHEVVVN